MTRRRRGALAALLLLGGQAGAQDSTPQPQFLLHLSLAPQGEVWIGQRVTATLTAMTPVRFVDPPSWPDLTAAQGRILVLPEDSTVPGTERLDGQSYAALQRSVSLFPAEAGALALAPPRMTVRVGGPDGQPVEATASAPAAAPLRIRVPPGVTDLGRLVVAPVFHLTAGQEGEAGTVRVGDAVTRSVRMEAEDTAAMLLPPVPWSAPEGVKLYPDPPVLHDSSDRGALRAQRSERAAFVPQRPGRVELPGFTVQWLDPRNGRMQDVTVPPLVLEVQPAAGSATDSEAAAAPGASWPVWGWGAFALLMAGLALGGWAMARRDRSASRPEQRLAALTRACRADDAAAALRALYRWADALLEELPDGEHSIARLAARSGVPALAEQAQALETRLYGSGTGGTGAGWSGRALLEAAEAAQQRLHRRARAEARPALPPLNPLAATP